MKRKPTTAIVVCGLALLLCFACGNGDTDTSQANAGVKKEQSASAVDIKSNVKGQVITVDDFKFVIPDDWTGDDDTQVWYPNTEDSNKPIPPHSLYHGARPMMGNPSFDDAIQRHIGATPVNKRDIKIGGMQGIECQWQVRNYKSIGVFLLEKGGGMNIMYFFICQARTNDFDQYVNTYKGILDSIEKK